MYPSEAGDEMESQPFIGKLWTFLVSKPKATINIIEYCTVHGVLRLKHRSNSAVGLN